jgi:Bacterial Ig-like domain (group 3)
VQAPLSDLAPGTQYFFRLTSTNAFAGTTHGETKTFTTPTAATATPPLTIDTTNLSSGTVGSHYADVITASGGTPKDTWTITGGSLPDGLQLASGTGGHLRHPHDGGTFGVTVQVNDAASPAANVNHSFAIVVYRAPSTTRLIGSTGRPRVRLPFTVSAIVDAAGGSLRATGEVSFTDNGTPVTCTGGPRSLDDRDVATCALVLSRPGSHSIIARYAGDRRVAGSSSTPLTLSVAGQHSWNRAKRR